MHCALYKRRPQNVKKGIKGTPNRGKGDTEQRKRFKGDPILLKRSPRGPRYPKGEPGTLKGTWVP